MNEKKDIKVFGFRETGEQCEPGGFPQVCYEMRSVQYTGPFPVTPEAVKHDLENAGLIVLGDGLTPEVQARMINERIEAGLL